MLKFFQSVSSQVSAQVSAQAAAYKAAPKIEVVEIQDDSDGPKPWVDGPYKLIPTPASYLDIDAHFAFHMANEMALVHNVFIRGFNAILLQGPHLPTPKLNAPLNHSWLIFVRSLLRAIHHHHDSEETVGFAAIEREIGKPGHLDVAGKQHEAFHEGLEKLDKYVDDRLVHVEEYRWEEMRGIIEGFMPALELHLREEVDLFVGLKEFAEEGLRVAWAELEKKAVEAGTDAFYDIFPVVLGCHDRTFENGSGENFPPIPAALRWSIVYWFGKRYTDAWQFCPSDGWSGPRPLKWARGEAQAKA